MGGLGNMMFQAAASYAYSKKYGLEHVLLSQHQGTLHNSPSYYFDNIFRNFAKSEENNWSVCTEPTNVSPPRYTFCLSR